MNTSSATLAHVVEAVRAFVATLDVCAAEDMGGHPACRRPGIHGPSEAYLARKRARGEEHLVDRGVYCDAHTEVNFRGREGEDNAPLSFAPLVRWLEAYDEERRMVGVHTEMHPNAKAATQATSACYRAGHKLSDVKNERSTLFALCETCKVVHAWPDH